MGVEYDSRTAMEVDRQHRLKRMITVAGHSPKTTHTGPHWNLARIHDPPFHRKMKPQSVSALMIGPDRAPVPLTSLTLERFPGKSAYLFSFASTGISKEIA